MKFVLEDSYSDFQINDNVKPIIEGLLQFVLEEYPIHTLDYFVVSEAEPRKFADCVKKYATIVGTQANVTQDDSYCAVGKTLFGLDEKGNLHQAIIIGSFVCREAFVESGRMMKIIRIDGNPDYEKELDKLFGIHSIVHELGHAVDYENQYRMFGRVDTKVSYNLEIEEERQQYFLHNAVSLWGEYYAEYFSYKMFRSPESQNENSLLQCVEKYKSKERGFNFERAYRILEFFLLTLAFKQSKDPERKMLFSDEYRNNNLLAEYVHVFTAAENAINELSDKYPGWKSIDVLKPLANVYEVLTRYEYEKMISGGEK